MLKILNKQHPMLLNNKNLSSREAKISKPMTKSWLAITSIILGILVIDISCNSFLGCGPTPINLLTIMLGVIAIRKKENKTLSICGIFIGLIPILFLVGVIIWEDLFR